MASNDRTELLRLYEALAPALTLYARTWVDAATAPDVVQDAFVALSRQRRVEAAKAWLYATVRNRALEVTRAARRREKRERRSGMREAFAPDAAGVVAVDGLAAALEALTWEEREAVVLRVWGGLTFEESARVTGVSAPTMFRRYQAALGTIRAAMEDASCRRQKD